jgi:hypothetical protein
MPMLDNMIWIHIRYAYIVGIYNIFVRALEPGRKASWKRAETNVVLIVLDGVLWEIFPYTATFRTRIPEKLFLGQWLNNTEVYLAPVISTQNHTIAGWIKLTDIKWNDIFSSESCMFGDTPSTVINGQTCEVFITSQPWQCYEEDVYNTCCQSCSKYKTNNTGMLFWIHIYTTGVSE